ncbi:MAG: oxidoreductase [Gammaproteobacteria bacterium]|nr:oxidoreductase [Gammaproteobacteria bacterium]MDE0414202.1 oxidoreductase [Gammaproteobacteria bacterium]MDE0455377.1 oxidoreductase [Gammaproteobacteria bacterium]
MSDTIQAIVARERDGKVQGQLETLALPDLPDEDVLVEISHSTLNYKDGLAVSGRGRICRRLPMVCGIDLAGVVRESRDGRFQPGERVLVNGYELSEKYWGGYAQRQRLRGDWLVPVPDAFTAEQAMALGTAGYTAMLGVHAIEDAGVTPDSGPALVTGATGGVGAVSVMLLARLGYQVTGVTGKPDGAGFLESLGAANTIAREELARDSRPLESENWAAVIDSVGGTTLATALAQTRRGGLAAAVGLAGGFRLPATVMPFILRGVTLRGIDSVMASQERRRRAWAALADLIDPAALKDIYRVAPMSDLPELADEILRGRISGRVVIDVNG